MTASPPSSGRVVSASRKPWLVSSAAPKKAATQPVPASTITGRPLGELGFAGGASWNVNTDSTSATAATAATVQNNGRQACASAWRPPINGPRATAPKMHMFMITAVSRSLLAGNMIARGGTAAISSRLVQRPWTTCPTMYMPPSWAAAVSTDPTTSNIAYTTSILRCGRCWANWTAMTVPTA